MDLALRGKRALVTGSSRGIGAAIAKALAREGVSLVVHGRSEGDAARVASEIGVEGGKAAVALGDLSTDDGAALAIDAALAAFGGIDIAVNNAGRADEDSWQAVSPDAWLDSYNVGVVSMTRVVRLLLPQMTALGWGRFIQIASIAASSPLPSYGAYGAAKAGVVNLTVSLAAGIAGSGITANAVSPGVIMSPEIEAWIGQTARDEGWEGDWPDHERRFSAGFLPCAAGRLGRAEEVADLVTFLASPRADYINGVEYRIDGGR
jgi:NAD(P)-dependent dehydrogenase (short-subunit alcohol dehydrogenase family)